METGLAKVHALEREITEVKARIERLCQARARADSETGAEIQKAINAAVAQQADLDFKREEALLDFQYPWRAEERKNASK